jgi:hypothetical protein
MSAYVFRVPPDRPSKAALTASRLGLAACRNSLRQALATNGFTYIQLAATGLWPRANEYTILEQSYDLPVRSDIDAVGGRASA